MAFHPAGLGAMSYKTAIQITKETMESHGALFLLHITDGYSFRNTIGIIKGETEYATMVLSKERVQISFMNSSKCAVHEISLNTREFAMYRYNIRDDEGELLPEYPVGFETSELFNTTKGIGRRDGIRLYWIKGDNRINIQPIKISTKDPGRVGALFVNILPMEHVRYDPGSYDSEPNIRVQTKDFADICGQANTLKCTTLEIAGHPTGVTFMGILANQTVAFVTKFISPEDNDRAQPPASNMSEIDVFLEGLSKREDLGNKESKSIVLDVAKDGELMTVRVPMGTVKALSKIHNISPTGTLLRFYFSEGRPTKLVSPIGTYGNYTVCLRNTSL